MSYRLLDSGHGRKLEDLDGVVVDRQAPSAIWSPRLERRHWERAQGRHVRSDRGGGHWEWLGREPSSWSVSCGPNRMILKPTPFGHIGLFAEQAEQWLWVEESCRALATRLGRAPEVLNLFAYTGGSSIAAARGGAQVTHVDAARGVVDWAVANARENGLEGAPVRWLVDDAAGFCARELRRGRGYDGIILDPPSFGRGKKGELWKIEDHLVPLLADLARLCAGKPGFLLLSCHSPGYTPIALEQLADDHFERQGQEIGSGEMWIPEEGGRRLPSGFYSRRRLV
ncbi:MAG: class I SAM-dependent methyltransferase [Planctomycetes bacterium]|nr:class I SAM-dependent methyltransferase [Planctomycetota bacterium]